jgi:phage-related protein
MPAGSAIIGRVAVKVLPDTTDFKRDTKKSLDRIEKTLYVKLPTKIDMTGAKKELLAGIRDLNKALKANDAYKIKVHTKIDGLDEIEDEIKSFKRRHDPVRITVKVDDKATLNIGKIAGSIGRIAAGSGKTIAVFGAIGLAAASTLALGSNLLAISAGLAATVGAAGALPGIAGGLAFGIGATVVALKDFNQVFPEVKGNLSELQDQMSENFWRNAEAPVRKLIDTLLPQLSEGLRETSTALGSYFAGLADSFREQFDGALRPMFDNLNASIDIAKGGTDALAGIVRKLGETGSEYLPRLAGWFVDISEKFDGWLAAVQVDGRLKGWIDGGIQALKDLGGVITGLGGIFRGLAEAALAAGGTPLGGLAAVLQRISDTVNTPAFQETLTGVFAAAHEMFTKIGEISGPSVERFFTALGDLLKELLPILGEGIGYALEGIADALAQIEVREAIVGLFEALRDAIKELAPYLPDIVKSFAGLVKEVTPLIPVLVEIAKYVLPEVIRIIDELSYIIGGLQRTFKDLVRDTREAWADVKRHFQTFRDFFIVDWKKLWSDTKTAISEKLSEIKNAVSTFFREAISQAAEKLAEIKDSFSRKWTEIKTTVSDKLGEIKQSLSDAWSRIKDTASRALGDLVSTIGTKVGEAARTIGELPGKAVAALASFGRELKGKATSAFGEMKTAISTGVGDAARTVGELPGKAVSALGSIGSTLAAAGRSLIDGLIGGIRDKFRAVRETLSSLTSMLPDWKGPADKDKVLLRDAGKLIMGGFINGLESQYGAVKKSLTGLTRDVAATQFASPSMALSPGSASAMQRMVGEFSNGGTVINKTLNYNAAPGSSLGSEEDLFSAASRTRMVGW